MTQQECAAYLRRRAAAIRKHGGELPKETLERIMAMQMAHDYERAASELSLSRPDEEKGGAK